ncbi:ABC transporter ATP-binding protein [Myxococcota bacterium]|nr:ABC transporter ATP-binding protein [Myxococcota bacterium]MBU1382389.1 ABC transporter ATP-binding protein [Myxococcota bacterium]MBU1499201.1 ABC transporter ATP-binding protein [Myxococcota bacterium]
MKTKSKPVTEKTKSGTNSNVSLPDTTAEGKSESEDIVECMDINCILSKNHILHDVSFSVKKNGITALIGLNGAGKTTVLKIISGLLVPSSGRVLIGGKDIAENQDILENIGILPEDTILDSELKVCEQLYFAARLRGLKCSVKEAVDRVTTIFELGTVWNYLTGELSRGYRQRLSLAVSLIHDPEIMILDEPTNGLDPGQIESLHEYLLTARKDHTVILSTHLLSEVVKLAGRALVIRQGRISWDGTTDDEMTLKTAILEEILK